MCFDERNYCYIFKLIGKYRYTYIMYNYLSGNVY